MAAEEAASPALKDWDKDELLSAVPSEYQEAVLELRRSLQPFLDSGEHPIARSGGFPKGTQ